MPKSRNSTTRRPALAHAREAAGYTQETFAARAGVEVSTVVRWESGTTTPLPGKRPRIARVLGVGLHELEQLLMTGRAGGAAARAGRGAGTARGAEPDDALLAALAGMREEITRLVAEYEVRPGMGLVVRAAGVLARVEELRSSEVGGGVEGEWGGFWWW
ncbi:helix-turn-helix domain-containing protein [Catenulispora yoronensis]